MSEPTAIETTPGRHLIRFDALEAELSATQNRDALLRNRRYRKAVFDALDDLVVAEDGTPGLLSLDVFVTVLLRDGSSQTRRFMDVGKRMAASTGGRIDPIDAFIARHLGTQTSYRAGPRVDGCGEGSLTEIHKTAARILGVEDKFSKMFISAELACEAEHVTPNPLLVSYIRKHRSRGGKVILISDMYMHARHIVDLLARLGIKNDLYDALYSSADTKISKASGRIFAHIPQAKGTSHVVHVGDSLTGDFHNPRAHGWKALLLPIPDALLEERAQDHDACMRALWASHRLTLDGEIAA